MITSTSPGTDLSDEGATPHSSSSENKIKHTTLAYLQGARAVTPNIIYFRTDAVYYLIGGAELVRTLKNACALLDVLWNNRTAQEASSTIASSTLKDFTTVLASNVMLPERRRDPCTVGHRLDQKMCKITSMSTSTVPLLNFDP